MNNIFPGGDVDLYAVGLVAGTRYEFSANQLCATCETFMTLLDTDGTTVLDANDDYVAFASAIQYQPAANGTYYVQVETLDPVIGLATYTLGARMFTDADTDNWSAFYDCDGTD